MFPFPDSKKKEITDPQALYQALSAMDDGFFPLAVNGFPHGGVHFGNGSASRVDQTGGVRCIADGEIVAYKIDNCYPHLKFADGKWAAYSTGFVLVRHRLTLPPAPNSKDAQPVDESQDLYSLYMHMADWTTYLADGRLPRPYWWDVDAFRTGNKEYQLPAPEGGAGGAAGAFVWTEPAAGKKKGQFIAGKQVGFLPEGSEVIVGEARGKWVRIKCITAGGMISPTSGGMFGSEDQNVPWEAPEGSRNAPTTPKGDWGWLFRPNLQAAKAPKVTDQVVVPATPIKVKAGTPLGQIGEYQDYERATPLPPTSRRRLLHLEVFADDGFSAFLARSRTRAAQLPADQRTLLVIDTGASLVKTIPAPDRKLRLYDAVKKVEPTADSPGSGPWVKVQPMHLESMGVAYHFAGPPVWIERDQLAKANDSTPAWSKFPLSLQGATDLANGIPLIYARGQLDAQDAQSKATDDQKINWWRVPFSMADGQQGQGWVCEKNHPGTRWESPWAWPGFETVDATGIQIADAFRRNLVISGAADWREQKEFEPSVAAVNNSLLLRKLEQAVAKLDTGEGKNKGGRVTARAIQSAMRVPSLAQALSHLILRYESEWGGDMTRWNSITALMRSARENWICELGRIKTLRWWNDVKGNVAGFPVSPTVLHIHPIALVANFAGTCSKSCKTEVVEFQTTEGTFRASKEAFDLVLSSEGYENRPYVPAGDQSSGVTIGYGYDLGQQAPAAIATDLNGIFLPEQIARLQTASGKHGDSARKLQLSLTDIEVSRDKAMQLAIVMKQRYAQYTVDVFPSVTKLHPHCQGALLSLVINRGSGMADKSGQKTRVHMRAIRDDIVSGNFPDVPLQWRAMKSLWADSGQGGLIARRENEAVLFEKGLRCNCWR
ncbi:pesticin C-terminus-like muramidase [Cupriavidus necator]|uniref:pesticin C-terminus-like muramidase n=1 Tax=Cupriavidus necator TaxID=106590 RepID=UPI0019D127D6|nr:pesticin C-terminus-like muramidase [Cupriavidus necator]